MPAKCETKCPVLKVVEDLHVNVIVFKRFTTDLSPSSKACKSPDTAIYTQERKLLYFDGVPCFGTLTKYI